MNSEKNVDIPILLILLAVLAAHIQLIFNDFHTDDWLVLDIMRHGFDWRAFISMENYSNFRPFVNIVIYFRSLILDNMPALWYLLNIALHLAAVYLIYILVKSQVNRIAAMVAALTFGIYFQHFEAVLWIYSIVRLIAAILLLLTLIYWYKYQRTGGAGDIILSYIFFALALFSVEDSIIFTLFFGVGIIISGSVPRPRKRILGLGYFLIASTYLFLRCLAIGFTDPSTESFFFGAHIAKNFYAYSIWTILPQLNHPYLINFVSKYVSGIIPFIGAINIMVFLLFTIAVVIIITKGNKLEKHMLTFLLLSLLMPSILDAKVSTKLMYIPSIAVAIIVGSLFNRLWTKFGRDARIILVAVLTVYLLIQAFAINATIIYYRTTQRNVRYIVNEIDNLGIDWSRYDYLLLDNLPGRARPGNSLKYHIGFNVRLLISNEDNEDSLDMEYESKKLAQMDKNFILIDLGPDIPVIVKKIPRDRSNIH